MLFHNFKYSFKTLFRNKSLIFWTFAFPLILGTFFYMAFSNIENGEKLDIIDIAIIETEYFENSVVLKETFDKLSTTNSDDQLFNTTYTNIDKAKGLLEKNEITGYLIFEGTNPKVVVKQSGINETILKYVVEEIMQTNEIINELTVNNSQNIDYSKLYENISKILSTKPNIKDSSSSKMSYTMIEFYTLIAMTCLYGGIIGTITINNNLANMSSKGKRIAITPISKSKLIFSSILAGYLVQIIGMTILFLYTIFVLNVDYGNNLLEIILLALLGCLAGLMLGITVATISKGNETLKIGMLTGITMFGCFLSGMMGVGIKYLVDSNIPLINQINPASMITDGFYSLYYYTNNNRYFFNIISLFIFSVIMFMISYVSLRRQKYDSI